MGRRAPDRNSSYHRCAIQVWIFVASEGHAIIRGMASGQTLSQQEQDTLIELLNRICANALAREG